MRIAIEILVLVVCVALIGLVLSQEGKDAGFGAALSGSTDSYWGKNRGRSKEGMVIKATTAMLVLLMVLCLVLSSKLFV